MERTITYRDTNGTEHQQCYSGDWTGKEIVKSWHKDFGNITVLSVSKPKDCPYCKGNGCTWEPDKELKRMLEEQP